MFANQFTVVVDACSLVDALGRNLLLSLAQADFFRVRWSARILAETERALSGMFETRGDSDAAGSARRARAAMDRAFGDATVTGYERLVPCVSDVPDPDDAHVIAAAIKTRASLIVTENLSHFPAAVLQPLDLEAKPADAFIADTIGLDEDRAVAAIRRMRLRFQKPSKTADALLIDLAAKGFSETARALHEHAQSL